MTLDVAEMERAAAAMRELRDLAREITPMLELLEELGGRAIVPQPVDRLLQRGEIREMLKIGDATISSLIASGKLKAYYVADSTAQKFWLSDGKKLVSTECPKEKVNNLQRKAG